MGWRGVRSAPQRVARMQRDHVALPHTQVLERVGDLLRVRVRVGVRVGVGVGVRVRVRVRVRIGVGVRVRRA